MFGVPSLDEPVWPSLNVGFTVADAVLDIVIKQTDEFMALPRFIAIPDRIAGQTLRFIANLVTGNSFRRIEQKVDELHVQSVEVQRLLGALNDKLQDTTLSAHLLEQMSKDQAVGKKHTSSL